MGKVIPMPTFTSDIALRADKCLNYVYRLDIGMVQGTKTPSKGMLSVAPGMMGFQVFGAMETTLKGADKEFYIQSEAGLSKEAVDSKKLTPKILKKVGGVELDPDPTGRFYHIDDYFFDKENQPTQKAVVNGGSGEVGMKVSASAFQALGPIPKVGWVLLALKKSGALDMGLQIKGLIGVRGLYGYKTVFPRQVEHNTGSGTGSVIIPDDPDPDPVKRQRVRSFIGGLETDNVVAASEGAQNLTAEEKAEMGITNTTTSSLDICVNFGTGIYAKAAGGYVGAESAIEIAGDDGWTQKPSLFIVVNTEGYSPVISQIKGDVRATTDVYVKAWIAKMKKRYVWAKIPIDFKFTTESTFNMMPMDVAVDESNRHDFETSLFHGLPELMVDQFLEIGNYSSDTTGSGVLAYTDLETAGGDMRLMAGSYSSDGSWNDPVCISKSEGAIVSHDIIKLPGCDNYLAVWSEIAGSDVEKTCPPSVIKYAVSEMVYGEWSWSNPPAVANLSEVATQLELVRNGDQVALVYMATDEGPMGVNYRISGLTWNGNTWSGPVDLVDRSPIYSFAACGSDDPALSPLWIAYVNDKQELRALSWHNAGVSAETLLEEQAGYDLALDNGSTGDAFLAWSGSEEGIGLYAYNDGEWSDQGTIFDDSWPNDLDLEVLPNDEMLVSWTDLTSSSVMAGVIGKDGTVINPAGTVSGADSGKYYEPSVVQAVYGSNGASDLYLFVLNEDADTDLKAYLLNSHGDQPVLEGTVSISGTAVVGQTLTADTSGLTNPSGILSYQWKRNGTIIADAVDDTYVPVAEDIGCTITVTVAASGNSGTITSEPTEQITDAGGSEPSHLADLSSLTLSRGTLRPPFEAQINNYTAGVPNSVSEISVVAVVYDSRATLFVNNIPVASGTNSPDISLDEGDNSIEVKVIGADDSTKIYTVTITREAQDECFIATAAYGSKLSGPVTLLRRFRDQYLLTNSPGTILVNLYYHYSPRIAEYIAGREDLKFIVRVGLAPVIGVVYLVYNPGVGLLVSGAVWPDDDGIISDKAEAQESLAWKTVTNFRRIIAAITSEK